MPYAYSGSLSIHPHRPGQPAALSGAWSVRLGNWPPADSAFSGKLDVNYALGARRYIVYSTADWPRFGGAKRIAQDALTLAYADTAVQLEAANPIVHYRPGQSQNLHHSPDNGYDAIAMSRGGGMTILMPEGVVSQNTSGGTPDTLHHGWLALGGPLSNYQLIQEGSRDHCSLSLWVQWQTKQEAYLWGFDQRYYRAAPADPDRAGLRVWGSLGYLNGQLVWDLGQADYDAGTYSGRWAGAANLTALPLVENHWHHLLLHVSSRGSSRLLVDGVCVQIIAPDRSNYDGLSYQGPCRWGLENGPKPAWLSMASGSSLPTSYPAWQPRLSHDPWPTAQDELLWAPVAPPEDLILSRFPDSPAAQVLYGPVEDLRDPSALAGIVRVALPQCQGTRLELAVRASNSSFSPGGAQPSWGYWWPVDGQTHAVGGESLGRYVQIRLRLTPDIDTQPPSAPTIQQIQCWIQSQGTLEGTAALPLKMTVETFWGSKALPLKLQVGGRARLPLHTRVSQTASADLPLKLRTVCVANLPLRLFIPAVARCPLKIHVDSATTSADLPLRLQVPAAPGQAFADLPLQIGVMQGGGGRLPLRIRVTTSKLPLRLRVAQQSWADLPLQLHATAEVPGPVQNLTSNYPAGEFAAIDLATFDWDTPNSLSPVAGYWWFVDDQTISLPTSTWYWTTSRHVEFDPQDLLGTGKWVFHVAAANVLGRVGAVSHHDCWFNHPPTRPGTLFMTVDDLDCLSNQPLVARAAPKQLAWSPAADTDAGDVMVYQLQVATTAQFGIDPRTGRSGLVRDRANLSSPASFLDLSGEKLLKSGKYFWRIRSSDGKSFSDWSPVGTLVVNQPPRPPGNLKVDPV